MEEIGKKKFIKPEVKYYQFGLTILSVAASVMLFPLFFLMIGNEDGNLYIGAFAICAMIFIPIIIYYGYRLVYFVRLNPTNLQKVKLEKVVSSYSRYVCFALVMDIDGVKKEVRTLPVFSPILMGVNLIDNFSQKTAIVGYDAEKDIAVIVEIVDNEIKEE